MQTGTSFITWEDWSSNPGGIRAFLALVIGSKLSLYSLQTLWWAEFFVSSNFTLKMQCPFTIKAIIAEHTRISQGVSGRAGMCLKLPAITSKAPLWCSKTNWKMAQLAICCPP